MTPTDRTLPMTLLTVALLLGAAALIPTGDALALERGGYSMEILIGGTPVCEYPARGKSYIEALKRREYSVRLHNLTAERIAIALSVDGLNSIDARTTTARDARKWVLGPYETITLDGWQVSSATARKFYFTTEEKSYGSWLGKTNNLGLIAAAVFREKRRPISHYSWPPYDVPFPQREEGESRDGESNSAPPAQSSSRIQRGVHTHVSVFNRSSSPRQSYPWVGPSGEVRHRTAGFRPSVTALAGEVDRISHRTILGKRDPEPVEWR